VVYDLNSTNGTLINGKPVDQQRLSSGDTLTFASVPTVYIEYAADLLEKARGRTRSPISEEDEEG
jgi:pSer/pThr/pTyr-binding forkhead associated (FHA) protein